MGDYYDVRGMKRILAISVGEFNALDPLPNSQIDKELILRTFSRLGFRPTQEKENTLTALDATKLIAKFCQKFESEMVIKPMKCLAIYLKSHGGIDKKGTVVFFRDQMVPLWDLLDPILKHPCLEGVPKIVIFEACRGQNAQFRRAGSDGTKNENPRMPVHRRVDTILFAASPEGEYAYTCVDEQASPFTETFCEVLDENPSQDVYDLSHTIVERLRHKPIRMTEGDTPIQYFMAPCTETSLTKRLRLYTPSKQSNGYMPAAGFQIAASTPNMDDERSSMMEQIRFLQGEREKLITENQNLQLDLNHQRRNT